MAESAHVSDIRGGQDRERSPGFVVMGVSVILRVRARNRPHTDVFGFKFLEQGTFFFPEGTSKLSMFVFQCVHTNRLEKLSS